MTTTNDQYIWECTACKAHGKTPAGLDKAFSLFTNHRYAQEAKTALGLRIHCKEGECMTTTLVPSQSAASVYKCCKPVFYHHEEGWDVYRKDDCDKHGNTYVPRWFDCFIIEDAKTKAEAVQELKELHPAGFCLVNA